ncbi:MAG: TolC family protein, partial [Mangrovibacterium sp.]|nr:TolC family protein [Mangrovibacterium sp.]
KARTDLAEMQATYEKEMLILIQTENTLEEVKLQLGQLMNLTAEQLSSFIIENEGEEPAAMLRSSLAADSLFNSFVQFSPYVKMAQAELNAASKNVAMTRGQYFPSVNLGADMNTVYSETNKDDQGNTIPFRDQINNNLGEYVGASLSIPIFGRNEVRNEVRKAKLAREQAETQLEQYRQAVYYELVNNSRELYALSREYRQTRKQLEANELAYQVAQRKYDEGLIDVIELLTVKNRVGESKGQLLNARLQWHIKSRIIEFYKGIRFWEGEGDWKPETGDRTQELEREIVAQGSGSNPRNVVE